MIPAKTSQSLLKTRGEKKLRFIILFKNSLLTFFPIKREHSYGNRNPDTKEEHLFTLLFYSCSEKSPNLARL